MCRCAPPGLARVEAWGCGAGWVLWWPCGAGAGDSWHRCSSSWVCAVALVWTVGSCRSCSQLVCMGRARGPGEESQAPTAAHPLMQPERCLIPRPGTRSSSRWWPCV